MIDVVIPVYRGLEQTRRCIESVLRSTPPPGEIVVVDDATPEPPIAEWLDGLAREGRITLLRNEANLGFVGSVNRGMGLHDDRDVVLLNSDTEVANDWLSRLSAAARGNDDIATATPFSNNATICSYPFWGWPGGTPGTLGLDGLDALIARTNAGRTVDIPTAVGFCMYIRRDALAALGLFDAARFGRGYGEENDFSMRAVKAGRRNVLAADVFVYHEGAVSFSDQSVARMEQADRALLEVHPDYHDRVQAFLAGDPAGALREAIDAARMETGREEMLQVLRERHAEQARWAGRAHEVEHAARRREAELTQALEAARGALRERAAAYDELAAELVRVNEEIERLRKGLAYAEELAFSRERELADIRRLPLFRYYDYLMRRSKGTA